MARLITNSRIIKGPETLTNMRKKRRKSMRIFFEVLGGVPRN